MRRSGARQFDKSSAIAIGTASNATIRLQQELSVEGKEVLLHCHSEGREAKEIAISTQFYQRYEAGLQKIVNGINKELPERSHDKLLERIELLKLKYLSAAAHFKLNIVTDDSGLPMAYQSAKVGVSVNMGMLLVHDLESGDQIAEYTISLEKGQIIKNTHHYRDIQIQIDKLEADIKQQVGDIYRQQLCALLKASSPKIYKDQLLGTKQVIQAHTDQHGEIGTDLLARILASPRLTATRLRDMLLAYQQHPERLSVDMAVKIQSSDPISRAHYANLNGQLTGQGERHVVH